MSAVSAVQPVVQHSPFLGAAKPSAPLPAPLPAPRPAFIVSIASLAAGQQQSGTSRNGSGQAGSGDAVREPSAQAVSQPAGLQQVGGVASAVTPDAVERDGGLGSDALSAAAAVKQGSVAAAPTNDSDQAPTSVDLSV